MQGGGGLTVNTAKIVLNEMQAQTMVLVVGSDIEVANWEGYFELAEMIRQGRVEIFSVHRAAEGAASSTRAAPAHRRQRSHRSPAAGARAQLHRREEGSIADSLYPVMSIAVKVVADSLAPCGERLISLQCEYPRIIHAEVMTHKDFSRNAASSRAIPIDKMIQRVLHNPAMPVHWGKNQKGMQAEQELDAEGKSAAHAWWLETMRLAVEQARKGQALGLHKQVVNRVYEPFQHMVTLISSTRWNHFFHLRYHKDADPTFQALAQAMYDAIQESTPVQLAAGDWHLPYIRAEDWNDAFKQADDETYFSDYAGFKERTREILRQVSTGRCARTSYLTQEGVRDLVEDISLHDRLKGAADTGQPGHWSPFEHPARAEAMPTPSGNFVGFTQYRKLFLNEYMNNTFTPPAGT
jgi:hypothetical protein